MTTGLPTRTCENCDYHLHKVEPQGAVLKARHWCELTKRRVSPSMKGCWFHKYSARYRVKGVGNVTQQTRHPET